MSTNRVQLIPPPNQDNDPETLKRYQKLIRDYNESVISGNKENLIFVNKFSRKSFKTVYWGYILLFVVGVTTTIFTIIKGLTATDTTDAWITFGFGGLSAAAFMTLFISRPLESIERNSIFLAWLSTALNSYSTRMMYLNDPDTIDKDIRAINKDFVKEMTTLAEKHAAAIGKYKDLENATKKEEAEDEANDSEPEVEEAVAGDQDTPPTKKETAVTGGSPAPTAK